MEEMPEYEMDTSNIASTKRSLKHSLQ